MSNTRYMQFYLECLGIWIDKKLRFPCDCACMLPQVSTYLHLHKEEWHIKSSRARPPLNRRNTEYGHTSIAPPPATMVEFFKALLTIMIASCRLLSASSMNWHQSKNPKIYVNVIYHICKAIWHCILWPRADLIRSTTKNDSCCQTWWAPTEYVKPFISNLPFLKNFTSTENLKE